MSRSPLKVVRGLLSEIGFSSLLFASLLLPSEALAQSPDRNEYGNPPPQVFESEDRDRWQKPEWVVEQLAIVPGTTVADLGAGSGYFTRRFSRAVGPSGKVLALDVDPTMLAHIAEDLNAFELANVDTVLVPFDSPGLPDRSVDLLFLSNTLHHIENRTAYYPRMIDVLREGGRVSVVDFYKKPLPVGPRSLSHKLARSDVIREFTRAGLHITADLEDLPHQYFLIASPIPQFLNARLVSQNLATGGHRSLSDLPQPGLSNNFEPQAS